MIWSAQFARALLLPPANRSRPDQKLTKFEYASAATSGRHSAWPNEQSCYRLVTSPRGQPGSFVGYATNMGASRQHRSDLWCRNGGLCAFLNDVTGWSPAYVNNTGVDSQLVVCGPHTDQDFTLAMAKIAGETKDGLTRYQVAHRMLALPPELTKHVWDMMELLNKGETALLLRLGKLEDFEDQPLPIDGRERGHPIGGTVTTTEARSGKKSVQFSGRIAAGSPTLCLRPNVTYRLEAWVKGAVKMTMRYQEWAGSPQYGEPLSASSQTGTDWQKLALEFTAPAWGPAVDLSFTAEGGPAYLDDFLFAPVMPATRE